MARPAEEMLYVAMEDFRVDVVVGKGPGATAIPLDLPPFTLVGATTRAGMLPAPLRDRFGFTGHLDFYEPAELERMLRRSARPARRRRSTDEGAARSPGAPAAPPGSPTGCCAGCATGPQVRGGRRPRPGGRARRARASTRSTSAASTGSTAPFSTRCARGSAAARSGCPRSPWPWARSRETVETVAEPFLVREGLLGPHAARPGGDRRGLASPRAARARGPAAVAARRRRLNPPDAP